MPYRSSQSPALQNKFGATPIKLGKRYRSHRQAHRQESPELSFYILVLTGAVTIGILAAWLWPTNSVASAPSARDADKPTMAICGDFSRVTCVVDGDTIWLNGDKIRIADIDTPEISDPKCQHEFELGMRATRRMRELLNKGPWSLSTYGERDTDRYDRKLRIITRDGQSIGNILVSEGLARSWTGRRKPWC